MTYTEIIKQEETNTTAIYLYKEGAFWKAYEMSAFLFCEIVQKYKPTKKEVKTLGHEVIAIGFPDAALELLKQKYIIEITAKKAIINIAATQGLTQQNFENWKNSVPCKIPQPREKTPRIHKKIIEETDAKYESIITRIEKFAIESATPLECMLFLSEIKQYIKTEHGTL